MRLVATVLAALMTTACAGSSAAPSDTGVVVPPPAVDLPAGSRTSDVAILAGGCFWGVQAVYQHVTGVTSAVSGYAGGNEPTRNTGRSAADAPGMPSRYASSSIRASSATAGCCRSSSPSGTIRWS